MAPRQLSQLSEAVEERRSRNAFWCLMVTDIQLLHGQLEWVLFLLTICFTCPATHDPFWPSLDLSLGIELD